MKNRLSPDQQRAGILVPLFAIRGSHDLGIGDVRSLRELIAWAAETGFGVVNLLPFNEPGGDPSPYNPISSIALDPLSLSLLPEELEDVTAESYQRALAGVDLAALTSGPVRYPEVRRLKAGLLEEAFARFETEHLAVGSPRSESFQRFVKKERPWLRPYALFRALMQLHGHERHPEWPKPHRTPQSAGRWLRKLPEDERANFERSMTFFSYVQWIAFGQWTAVQKFARQRGVAIMGDVPLGVSYYSADVFAGSELFDLTWSIGAPPDSMSVAAPVETAPVDAFRAKWGQNWGFPLYAWATMQRDGLRWWRRRVGRLRHFVDLFRIDHILGFYRVYAFPWRPELNDSFAHFTNEQALEKTGGLLPRFLPRPDETAEDRAANCADGEGILRVLVEEAGAGSLIGEDLGCVPDYVRPSLHGLGIAGYKVPLWETGGDGMLIPGDQYERLSVAMYVTHDHAPLRAQWSEWSRAIRNGPDHRAAEEGRKNMRQLCRYAGLPDEAERPLDYTDELHRALIAALLRCNSWLAIFMITDLYGREERFNVPGASGDENWTQRMHVPIAELNAEPQTAWLRDLLAKSGRAVKARRLRSAR